MICLVRVDNRLIHGQVIEGWLPVLAVDRLLVADDLAASNTLTRLAMGLAVPPRISTEISRLDDTDFAAAERAPARTLLLVRDVEDVVRARARGLRCPYLNLGNVHFAPGRAEISPSVFLAPGELDRLRVLAAEGVQIDLRALPRDRPLALAEIEARARAAPRPDGP